MNLEQLHEQARLLASLATPADEAIFMDRLSKAELSLIDITSLGIAVREGGNIDCSLRVFEKALIRSPAYVPALYEAAFANRLVGRPIDAARLLLKAQSTDSHNMRVNTALLHMLYACGAKVQADKLYDHIAPLAGDDLPSVEAIREFGLYTQTWSLSAAILLLEDIQQRAQWMDVRTVSETIVAALDAKTPFALIRAGDGEGTCVTLGAEDEARYPNLYKQNRDEFARYWFGGSFQAEESGFSALGRNLMKVLLACDIAAIPYRGWLEHEFRIASLRGVPSLINILRGVSASAFGHSTKPMFCTQLIHVELQRSGELERIIRKAKRISLISCMPDLPSAMQRRFDLEEVTFYKIPGEQAFATTLGPEAVAGTHYPFVFDALMKEEFNRPHEGKLFLIAGGILGKFYADTIRRNGGIAVDIGSVADSWANKITRPGMDSSLAL